MSDDDFRPSPIPDDGKYTLLDDGPNRQHLRTLSYLTVRQAAEKYGR
jgi:hypothetical protein